LIHDKQMDMKMRCVVAFSRKDCVIGVVYYY
jgi:hypothetical protein